MAAAIAACQKSQLVKPDKSSFWITAQASRPLLNQDMISGALARTKLPATTVTNRAGIFDWNCTCGFRSVAASAPLKPERDLRQ
jgi:hypothetical protein